MIILIGDELLHVLPAHRPRLILSREDHSVKKPRGALHWPWWEYWLLLAFLAKMPFCRQWGRILEEKGRVVDVWVLGRPVIEGAFNSGVVLRVVVPEPLALWWVPLQVPSFLIIEVLLQSFGPKRVPTALLALLRKRLQDTDRVRFLSRDQMMTASLWLRSCKTLRRDVSADLRSFIHNLFAIFKRFFDCLIALVICQIVSFLMLDWSSELWCDVGGEKGVQLVVLDVEFLHDALYHRLLFFLNSPHELKVVFVDVAVFTFVCVVTILDSSLWGPLYFQQLLQKVLVPLRAIELGKHFRGVMLLHNFIHLVRKSRLPSFLWFLRPLYQMHVLLLLKVVYHLSQLLFQSFAPSVSSGPEVDIAAFQCLLV